MALGPDSLYDQRRRCIGLIDRPFGQRWSWRQVL